MTDPIYSTPPSNSTPSTNSNDSTTAPASTTIMPLKKGYYKIPKWWLKKGLEKRQVYLSKYPKSKLRKFLRRNLPKDTQKVGNSAPSNSTSIPLEGPQTPLELPPISSPVSTIGPAGSKDKSLKKPKPKGKKIVVLKSPKVNVEKVKRSASKAAKGMSKEAKKPGSKSRKKAAKGIKKQSPKQIANAIGMEVADAEKAAEAIHTSANPSKSRGLMKVLSRVAGMAVGASLLGGSGLALGAIALALPAGVQVLLAAAALNYIRGIVFQSTAEPIKEYIGPTPYLNMLRDNMADMVERADLSEIYSAIADMDRFEATAITFSPPDDKGNRNVIPVNVLPTSVGYNHKSGNGTNKQPLSKRIAIKNQSLQGKPTGFKYYLKLDEESQKKLRSWAIAHGLAIDPNKLELVLLSSSTPPLTDESENFPRKHRINHTARISGISIQNDKLIMDLDSPSIMERAKELRHIHMSSEEVLLPELVLLDRVSFRNISIYDLDQPDWGSLTFDFEGFEIMRGGKKRIEAMEETAFVRPNSINKKFITGPNYKLQRRGGPQGSGKIDLVKVTHVDSPGLYMAFSLSPDSAARIRRWAKVHGIPNPCSEPDLHCSIIYSRATPVQPCGRPVVGRGRLKNVVGFAQKVMRLGSDAIVLKLFCPDAVDRNKQVMGWGASSDFPSYIPHITVGFDEEPTSSSSDYRHIPAPDFPIYFNYEVSSSLKDMLKEKWSLTYKDKALSSPVLAKLETLSSTTAAGAKAANRLLSVVAGRKKKYTSEDPREDLENKLEKFRDGLKRLRAVGIDKVIDNIEEVLESIEQADPSELSGHSERLMEFFDNGVSDPCRFNHNFYEVILTLDEGKAVAQAAKRLAK